MRKTVKITAGWVHATLILAILSPLCYSLGAEQRSVVSRTLYFCCLLIVFPVVVTGIAAEKCKGLLSYLLVCILTFAATGALCRMIGSILYQDGEAKTYLMLLLAETLFMIIARLVGRLHRQKEKEAIEKQIPLMEKYSEMLKEPSPAMLIYFLLVYVLALNVNSPEVCNEALFSAAVYGVTALLYCYVTATEDYLSLNKRTCNLPSKRIYGIGSGVLAIFLLLLMLAVLPSFLTISGRNYQDIRNGFENFGMIMEEYGAGAESIRGGDILPDWVREMGEPEPAPEWVNYLFYAAGAVIFLFVVAALVKVIFQVFRDFREAGDENGDIVEELKDADMGELKKVRVQKERRSLTQRERIRKQYRRFIRSHRKEQPAVYESPAEIEAKAGVAQSEEGKEFHAKYEYFRYGRGME